MIGGGEAPLLELYELMSSNPDALSAHIVKASMHQLPLRAESLDYCLIDSRGIDPEEESRLLLEVNRALREGGGLIYIPRRGEGVGDRLLEAGFALIGERDIDAMEAYHAVKTWRRYLSESCPRCGGRMIMPLKPSDSKVSKLWNLYCTNCSYTWSVGEYFIDLY